MKIDGFLCQMRGTQDVDFIFVLGKDINYLRHSFKEWLCANIIVA